MSVDSAHPVVAAATDRRLATTLAFIGAWTAIVAYAGRALGLVVDVPARVEFVDHVVPGACVVAAALYLRATARRRAFSRDRFALLASGVAFLAGFWELATHAPLIVDASRARVSWDAAIWHSAGAVPVVAVACWCILRSIPEP